MANALPSSPSSPSSRASTARRLPGIPSLRRLLRLANMLAIAFACAMVALAMTPGLTQHLRRLALHAGNWIGGLGPLAVLGGFGALVAATIVVSVSTEREFSETDEFYRGH